MQDLKVRAAWVYFPVGVTFWILLFPCDSVESTESIEFKANYGKNSISPCIILYNCFIPLFFVVDVWIIVVSVIFPIIFIAVMVTLALFFYR